MNLIRVPLWALLATLLLLVAACASTQTPGASASPSPEDSPEA